MNILSWLLSFFRRPVPHNTFPTDNQGVLEGVKPEDFVAGAIPFEVRNASADWRPYLPSDERQSNGRADTMACVSYSFTNCVEIQLKKLTGQDFNFSDRFLAKLSGTTRQGNYLNTVADTARKLGLVKQETWPEPNDYTWESYYTDIPPDVVIKGKTEFPFAVAYEWIPSNAQTLAYHLRHAPIQITIPGSKPYHAVVLVYVDVQKNLFYYYDSYAPHLKTMSGPPASALKVVLTDSRIVMRQVGWSDKEKGVYVPFDTETRKNKFYNSMTTLFPDYRLEEKEWNLFKRPW